MKEQLLIVGLGNPGTKYAHNRHNIGFLAADALAEKYGASLWAKKFGGHVAEASASCLVPGALESNPGTRHKSPGTKLFLLKPQTYMNLSGESVAACARFYKIPTENIIVLHDELDLPPGKLKVKQGGGNGGHNGLRSIDAHMGEQYVRVRIGIGHPGDKDRVSDYVLSDFSREEWQVQEKMLDAIKEAFALLLASDAAGFMNKVALQMSPSAIVSPSPLAGEG